MATIDLTLQRMAVLYVLALLPLAVMWRLQTGTVRDAAISILRMTVQLALVGLYLKYIFAWNRFWVSALWVLAMLIVANVNILRRAGLRTRPFFFPSLAGIAAGTLPIVAVYLLVLIRPRPLYDARYFIPLAGMVLGNCLSGNILVLERFFSSLRKEEEVFLSYLLMGATRFEAIRPYFRDALRVSLAPTIATMMTIGIVALPGMMTGQILGGSFPLVAIKYQIAIMLGIFIGICLSAAVGVLCALPPAFDAYGLLRDDIGRK